MKAYPKDLEVGRSKQYRYIACYLFWANGDKYVKKTSIHVTFWKEKKEDILLLSHCCLNLEQSYSD